MDPAAPGIGGQQEREVDVRDGSERYFLHCRYGSQPLDAASIFTVGIEPRQVVVWELPVAAHVSVVPILIAVIAEVGVCPRALAKVQQARVRAFVRPGKTLDYCNRALRFTRGNEVASQKEASPRSRSGGTACFRNGKAKVLLEWHRPRTPTDAPLPLVIMYGPAAPRLRSAARGITPGEPPGTVLRRATPESDPVFDACSDRPAADAPAAISGSNAAARARLRSM